MCYEIGEFSSLMGVSVHTLRYYEKEQLIIPQRRQNGRRYYTEQDAEWMTLIGSLKDTGMPIKEMQHYAQLRTEGDQTMPVRIEMLYAQRELLVKKISQFKKHLKHLDAKIALCEDILTHL